MSRIFAAFLLIVVLAIGGSAIAATAYQAGLTTAVAQLPADGATVVTPIVIPGYGYGLPGFGFLGFLGSIFFLILVFGLLRAIFGRGGGHGHGWGPGGPGGPERLGRWTGTLPRDLRGMAPRGPRNGRADRWAAGRGPPAGRPGLTAVAVTLHRCASDFVRGASTTRPSHPLRCPR